MIGVVQTFEKKLVSRITDLFMIFHALDRQVCDSIIMDLINQLPVNYFTTKEKERLWISFEDAFTSDDIRKLRHVLLFFHSNCHRKLE